MKPHITSNDVSIRGRIRAALLATLLAGMAMAQPTAAADLRGNCCADLEERIAELEATTARKGNRKVSLTLAGQVNQSILFWDDGREDNAYVVGNVNDNSLITLGGEASIAPGWKAGYFIELWLGDNFSDGVDQTTDDAEPGIIVWQSNWFIESEKLGKITLGQAARASDGAPEIDLSEAGDASYSGVRDIGGGFFLRRRDGGLAETVWGDLTGNFNGDTGNLVRYDSPSMAGFTFVASWGEDDMWDVAGYYEGEGAGLKIAAGIAYSETTDENGLDGAGDVPNSTILGSVSILHEPSGLNVTVAAGQREFEAGVEDADIDAGVSDQLRKPAEASFVYAKLGWIAQFNPLGPTAFYADYGWYENFLSAGLDADGVSSLSFTDTANVCAAAGEACRARGSEAEIWGAGVVQHIEAAEMQVYLGWRHWSADVDLVDINGDRVTGAAFEDFDTVIGGSRIAF